VLGAFDDQFESFHSSKTVSKPWVAAKMERQYLI
jgi:hypothetical protein